MQWVELLINGFVVALLLVTIAYCRILNKRIRILQDGKGELAKLLKHFDESTERASDSIHALQDTSQKISKTIQNRIEKANFLVEELTYQNERGMQLLESLDAEINIGRSASRVRRPAPPAVHDASRNVPTAEERDIIKSAVQAVKKEETRKMQGEVAARQAQKMATPKKENSNSLSSLQAMLEKLAARAGTAPEPTPKKPQSPASAKSRTRSRAEEELLEIIRAGKV